MADSILVRHIPGGVWPGAWYRLPHGALGDTWRIVPSGESADRFNRQPELVCEVWLNDELGLGLAGLAGRVAQRCRVDVDTPWAADPAPHSDEDDVKMRVVYAQFSGFDESDPIYGSGFEWPALRDLPVHVLVAIATGIALTDQLCAAVGLELQPGEVARWDLVAEQGADQSWYCWRLTAGDQHLDWELSDSTWLPALEAALAGVQS